MVRNYLSHFFAAVTKDPMQFSCGFKGGIEWGVDKHSYDFIILNLIA